MTQLNYKKIWTPLSDAYARFGDELIEVLKDGGIIAKGRNQTDQDLANIEEGIIGTSDDGTLDLPEPVSIQTNCWQTHKFDPVEFTLTKSFSTKQGGSGFYCYYDIHLMTSDLETLVNNEQAPTPPHPVPNPDISPQKGKKNTAVKRESELIEVIGTLFFRMKKEKGRNPTATEVWRYIKNNYREFACIQDFDRDHELRETIFWRSYKGNDQEMRRGRFDTLISEFKTGKRPPL